MPEANCLAGCIAEYYCSPLHRPGPAGEQAESFAPIVKVQIGELSLITVGNKSYPADPHTAVIKSYEIGWVDSQSLTIEILDEAGGRFGALIDGLRKCATVGRNTLIKSRFGWVITTCEGSKKVIESPLITSVFTGLEVNYSEGKIKYRLTGTALDPIYADMREDKINGEEFKGMKLEDAIEQLCGLDPPMRVSFCERQPDGKLKCGKNMFDWEKFGKGGPRAAWQADNQNRISTISKWIEGYRIKDGSPKGKGLILLMDSITYDHLIILKDPTLDPGEGDPCDVGSLGTFIVNGGKCSSVIEFTPKFNWISGLANFNAGGETASAADTRPVFAEDPNGKTPNQEKEHGKNVGLQQQTTINQSAWNAYGPKNAHYEVLTSQQRHNKANRIVEIDVESITADLKILGDPRPPFVIMSEWIAQPVSIVAINPFHIVGNDNGGCGEWLAKPGCNQILSNKSWKVQGINHSIKEGSFTTTLKLFLAAPAIEVGHNDPLGGVGSMGPTVKNTC